MPRTPGSGWGSGTLLYQNCPYCKKKKVIYDPVIHDTTGSNFRCTLCKKRFHSDTLIRKHHPETTKEYRIEGRRRYYHGMWHTQALLKYTDKKRMNSDLRLLNKSKIYEFREVQ
ncbi:MAG: hypothetical protein WC979_08370 [Candidatus Pacearchaeota archaeon]|jgi:transcription initiation factor TFIIIB Brf1 subunit/transcription initiation factor TFIIB